MTVEEIVTDFSEGEPVRARLTNAARGGEKKLLECMAVCNTVKGTAGRRMGDPTEVALVNFADSLAFSCEYTRLGGIPFTSERKMMSVAARTAEGSYCFVKGGCDVVLSRCTRIWSGGSVRPLTDTDRCNVAAAAHSLACRALRVLGFAYREYTGAPREDELIFVGICGMIDPPKQGVKEAVAECRAAGITPVMITGDHRDTAYAIASRLGIAQSEREVVTGAELDGMSEAELAVRVPAGRVFARVSPKHKSMIVGQFQRAGNVVAMTGDGTTTRPASARRISASRWAFRAPTSPRAPPIWSSRTTIFPPSSPRCGRGGTSFPTSKRPFNFFWRPTLPRFSPSSSSRSRCINSTF